jgi:hypothetical protein
MHDVLSGALPAPQDEPPQRDVVDAAMDWGTRRQRRDWALSGATALAVVALGAGIATMSGGSGNEASPGGGPRPSASGSSFPNAPGSFWTPSCDTPGKTTGSLGDYCRLFKEEQSFGADFAKGSMPFIQKDLPTGFTVKATGTYVLILAGPGGTNYLFPSVESASTLDGHPLSCGTPAPPICLQTSTAGGSAVVGDASPSGGQSAGYAAVGKQDLRVDILVGTSTQGGINGLAAPTAAALLSSDQLLRITTDPKLLEYAKSQLTHLQDITRQLQSMAPPSPSGPVGSLPSGTSSPPAGNPSTGASSSWSSAPSGASSSGIPSWSSPSGVTSSESLPRTQSSSIPTQPSDSSVSSAGSWPSSAGSWPSSPPTVTTSSP